MPRNENSVTSDGIAGATRSLAGRMGPEVVSSAAVGSRGDDIRGGPGKKQAEEGAKRPQLKVWGWMACRRSSAVASRLNVARNTNHGLGVDERLSVIDLEIVNTGEKVGSRKSTQRQVYHTITASVGRVSLAGGGASEQAFVVEADIDGSMADTLSRAGLHLDNQDIYIPRCTRITTGVRATRFECQQELGQQTTPTTTTDANTTSRVLEYGFHDAYMLAAPLPVWLRWAATPQFGTPHPPASGLQGWDWVGWGVLYRLLAMQHCWASSRCAYAAYIGAGHPSTSLPSFRLTPISSLISTARRHSISNRNRITDGRSGPRWWATNDSYFELPISSTTLLDGHDLLNSSESSISNE
ncbi:hypothetical protein BDZ89DRAFT_1044245 [Hymenopellis radicata]|nr:hypothetical protein BDZ89DRAFT_1044245 [Hymenopellis radicata]